MTAAITWAQSAERRVWVAAGPGGDLRTVTMVCRSTWVPTAAGPDGRTRWRGEPRHTRMARRL
jgi:hypothetical protein